jgi:hypothetical protein
MSSYSDGRPLQKYAYLDHDTDLVNEAPPIQNQWYTVFDAYDVRLLWCVIRQLNDEAAAKTLNVRWIIDGNIYLESISAANDTPYWVFRNWVESTGGTLGLSIDPNPYNAARYVDKRGQRFKVEVRITSALGTNQILRCWCVRETLEAT